MDSTNEKTKGKHNKRSSIGRRNYDSSNVMTLVINSQMPHAGTVGLLRELLELAEAGEVTGIAYVIKIKNNMAKGSVGLEARCRNLVKGTLLSLANEI